MALKNGATTLTPSIHSFASTSRVGPVSGRGRSRSCPATLSQAFSDRGDAGSAVVAGDGKLAGLLTGGAGVTKVSDCTYITSIDAILEGLAAFSFKANLYPTFAA